MSNKKNQPVFQREAEARAARLLGKQVSPEKGRALLIISLLASALPMVLGARLWGRIPLLTPTGLIGANGQDDSLPRWVVAFGMPGLMCILDFLVHRSLWLSQKRQVMPPSHVRLMGRWGFPILSVFLSSGLIFYAVGQKPTSAFLAPCILGLGLLVLGGHMWDCPRDSRIALRFSALEQDPRLWDSVHRLASRVWMAAGLVVIAGVMITVDSFPWAAVVAIAALLAPVFAAMRGRGGI